MIQSYTEELQAYEKIGDALTAKWAEALNSYGGIRDPHMARTVAICLENYMNYLKSDPQLMLEDQIQSNSFQGVNLALLGLIRRSIPEIIGLQLVGTQAMPTPESPLFFMVWEKAINAGLGANMAAYNPYTPFGNQGTNFKGASVNGEELWATPLTGADNVGTDPYFTSNFIRDASVTKWSNAPADLTAAPFTVPLNWLPVLNGTLIAKAVNATGVVTEIVHFPGVYGSGVVNGVSVSGTPAAGIVAGSQLDATGKLVTIRGAVGTVDILFSWEYHAEGNPQMSELALRIHKRNVRLQRRQIRGRVTLDSITDANVLHGISLETELYEMIKLELTNEINREIIRDLRTMAAIRRTLDYNAIIDNTTGVNIRGNYDDLHKFVLDAIGTIRAEIWSIGRMGYANFVVGNPTTLSFLDRVPGFVGSGVTLNSTGLSYAGSIGALKFYRDPQYPQGELLIGYKGNSNLETGYIHAPYLPITATPTFNNQLTGDPIKIFYTRYGKTYEAVNPETGLPSNAIYCGEYQYATLKLVNFPMLSGYSVGPYIDPITNGVNASTFNTGTPAIS